MRPAELLTLNTAAAPISRWRHDLGERSCSRESRCGPPRPDVQVQRPPSTSAIAGKVSRALATLVPAPDSCQLLDRAGSVKAVFACTSTT